MKYIITISLIIVFHFFIYFLIYSVWYISASKYLLDKYYICELNSNNTLNCVKNYKDINFKIN